MLSVDWKDELLTIRHPTSPARVHVNYLEAFCRDRSSDRAWEETVIPHRTQLIEATAHRIRLQSILSDGVVVDHLIEAREDEIAFHVRLHNPTKQASRAHWAQPCIRAAQFCGVREQRCAERYLPQCFVFIDGQLSRLPTNDWNQTARYTPGQAWAGPSVDVRDLNPRPINPKRTSNGLIGCFNADETQILATAWEPYQELFQGIFCCIHSDFRIGGLLPDEKKEARGKVYWMNADLDSLLSRYTSDFSG
jgi:hypothetical protein